MEPRAIPIEAFRHLERLVAAGLQVRFTEDVKVTLVMNEKTASVYFPNLEGRMDLARGCTGETQYFMEVRVGVMFLDVTTVKPNGGKEREQLSNSRFLSSLFFRCHC